MAKIKYCCFYYATSDYNTDTCYSNPKKPGFARKQFTYRIRGTWVSSLATHTVMESKSSVFYNAGKFYAYFRMATYYRLS
jgi:hypothetical protein